MTRIEPGPAPPPRPTQPVLIINPRSGGGTATRLDLPGACAVRGIEAVVLQPGDDIRAAATAAVAGGADVIGVAGGDGSQAAVAAIAAAHDVAFVCVPAGTRNHFAFDLGIDRHDVVGALDLFGSGEERRIDLARVNSRIFVNNASMGVYAEIVQSPEYRDAKVATTARLVPELVPPQAAPFALGFTAPDGSRWDGVELLLVSNNPYHPPGPGAPGNRGGIDAGVLGVVAVRVVGPRQLSHLRQTPWTGAVPRLPGVRRFATPVFTVESDGPVAVALDGEAAVLEAPLRFTSLAAALRVRVPTRRRRRSHPWSPQSDSTQPGT